MAVEQFVNVAEAVSMLGCTTGRVRQLLGEGSLAGVKANERAWLIDRSDVEKMLQNTPTVGRPRTSQKKSDDLC